MPHSAGRPDPNAGVIRRALQYAFYDWSREMPRWKRVLTWIGLFIQGYALYAAITRSLIWPFVWPESRLVLLNTLWLLYASGGLLINAMLSSELIRKTQLEVDLTAARRIQETLHPRGPIAMRGGRVEALYTPFRQVGGDYFDVIDLPDGTTLFAMADVAGKGMSAALLAANVQALVRSIAVRDPRPLTLATEINRHLNTYSPDDRFVTAVFAVLHPGTGLLTYVNAGHNAPFVASGRSVTSLAPSGVPLGLFPGASYESATAVLDRDAVLLLYTDGLPDSIRADDPDARIRDVARAGSAVALSSLTALVDRRLNADDITIVLVKREPA